MGADFLLYTMRAPHFEEGIEREDSTDHARILAIGLKRIETLTPTLEWPSAIEYIFDSVLQLEGPEDDDLDLDSAINAEEATRRWMVDKIIKAAKESLVDALSHGRQTTWIDLGGGVHIVTGGLSWGDSPTEIAPVIDLMDEIGVFDAAISQEEWDSAAVDS